MPTKPSTSTTRTRKPVVEPQYIPEPTILEPTILEDDTITFKRSHFFIVISALTFAFGLALGYVIWGTNLFSRGVANSQAANQAPVEEEPQFIRYDIPSEGYPSLGPKDAPITIVEFSDFQCPFCKQWHQTVYEPLLAAYPDQIRLVYRHLPLTTIHPDAESAAEAAMCANEQNAFWGFHDKLFEGEALGAGVYSQYASALGLDVDKFEDCVNNRTYQQAVQKDSDFALDLGINSTPTFFVNGLAIVGAQPLNVFQDVIDKELAGEFPK
ncbi:MAG: DsbA family protein [Anaerolineales bacterium]|nr:DsbA family protein [Anaerolineales bacterium]